MKKRIDTLMYDTDTAKEIAKYESPYSKGDNEYYEEYLYKKRTGEFFLYGYGNAGSPYCERAYKDNAFTPGEKIIPLTFEEAKKWYDKAFNADEKLASEEVYNREFAIKNDDDPVIATTVRLHKSAKIKLQKLAQKQGISQSEVIENFIKFE